MGSPKRYVVAAHGRCFDGLASAIVFTEFAEQQQTRATFEYVACGYGSQKREPKWCNEENAVLDYRYFPSDRLTYYFDHHPTAFVSEADQAHFHRRAQAEPGRFVWNQEVGSCTQMMAHHFQSEGTELGGLAELIEWAHRIDTASFSSAEEATDLSHPVMRLGAVVAHYGDSHFYSRAIEAHKREGLLGLCNRDFVLEAYRALAPKWSKYARAVSQHGRLRARVVHVELSFPAAPVVLKFAQYQAFPQAVYSLLSTSRPEGIYLSVGHNPWSEVPCCLDIGALCRSYGGGGHRYVGGIFFETSAAKQACAASDRIRELLEDAAVKMSAPCGAASNASPADGH